MRISLCMICRDEAEQLERCLTAVRGVVDESCVIDTGSRDGTAELARRMGARVGAVEWREDFSAARNASLALATGDWALVLDADEQLEPAGAREALTAFARPAPPRLGRLEIVSVDDDGSPLGREAITRFLPLDRGLRFDGRVHEQVVGEGDELLRADTGVRARHGGYAASVVHSRGKLERNRRLLERSLEEHPGDPYLSFQLARTFARAGDAASAWEAAGPALSEGPSAPWRILLLEVAAGALRDLGRPAEAAGLLEQARAAEPERPDTTFLLALCRMDEGRLEEAERGFRRCLTLDPARADDPGTATWAPAHNLGVMCEVLGLVADARAFFELALRHRPGYVPSREALVRVTDRT